MDRVIYLAAGGASRLLEQQAVLSNNLANVNTTGFRAQLTRHQSVPVSSPDTLATRAAVVTVTPGSRFEQGSMSETGRALDVAIRGEGWFVVQTDTGPALTRAGNFQVDEQSRLVTADGYLVLSVDNEPLDIPERAAVSLGTDGTLYALGAGNAPVDQQEIGQLKLVRPPEQTLERGGDGLFRLPDGLEAPPDETIRLVSGFLEKSNVSAAESMVGLIQNARHFETQMKVIQTASSNAERGNSILSSGA